jgi:hypothetical protein
MVIIAKTSLTELANWVAQVRDADAHCYNAISGFGMNPHEPRRVLIDSAPDGN